MTKRTKKMGHCMNTLTTYLPCGRTYSGGTRNIDKLVHLHKKKCLKCTEIDISYTDTYVCNAKVYQHQHPHQVKADIVNRLITQREVKQ